MAANHAKVVHSVEKQLTQLLAQLRSRKTRGLYVRFVNGEVRVDTLLYSTNTEWRRYPCPAADRERTFIEEMRPIVTSLKSKIRVHPNAWNFLDVMGCLYYENGEIEIEISMSDPDTFERSLLRSDWKWDGSPKHVLIDLT